MLDSLFESLDQDQIDSELNRRGYQFHASGLFDPSSQRYLSYDDAEVVIANVLEAYEVETFA